MHDNRSYLIFSLSEIDLVDFNQVCETSVETLRLSVDQTKTFIKWDGAEPDFVIQMTTKEGPYTYSEFLEVLETEEWTNNGSDTLP